MKTHTHPRKIVAATVLSAALLFNTTPIVHAAPTPHIIVLAQKQSAPSPQPEQSTTPNTVQGSSIGNWHFVNPFAHILAAIKNIFDAIRKFFTPDTPDTSPEPSVPNNGGADFEQPNTVNPTPQLVGPGVTLKNGKAVGSEEQWGHISGIVAGTSAWVLSTGKVSEAVGPATFFASTDMQQPGSTVLSTMSGWETHDAASYRVEVVPTGTTLHVDYAFATEEFPSYVGSRYNDIMGIFVNGQNCAVVPGTDTPISVNTVNHKQNSQYFINNIGEVVEDTNPTPPNPSPGDGDFIPASFKPTNQAKFTLTTAAATAKIAAPNDPSGLNTAYNGVTTGLRCSVPVTPGKPVEVIISVADTSDHIYDSGVALLDKGIWSE